MRDLSLVFVVLAPGLAKRVCRCELGSRYQQPICCPLRPAPSGRAVGFDAVGRSPDPYAPSASRRGRRRLAVLFLPVIARIGKTYSFEAAHVLPNHGGKCARLHGHNYTATIEIEGPICDVPKHTAEGMVLDYFDLDTIWAKHLEPHLDHRFLNDTLDVPATTAEYIAAWIASRIVPLLNGVEAHLAAVEVKETPKTFARVEVGAGGIGL